LIWGCVILIGIALRWTMIILISPIDILCRRFAIPYVIIFPFGLLIWKHLICLVYLLKILLFAFIEIGMISLGKCLKAWFYLLLICRFLNVENFIVIFGCVVGLNGKSEQISYRFEH
jgi:hypothetical protein